MDKKGVKRKKYSAEFKTGVIMDMWENDLSYRETVRKYWKTKSRGEEDNYRKTLKSWERIYLAEGAKGLMKERWGRGSSSSGTRKGRPVKLDKKTEGDFIAENQRLRMEIEYLKKTQCLSSEKGAEQKEKSLIIEELRQRYPLEELLKLSGVARSTYYYYRNQKDNDKSRNI